MSGSKPSPLPTRALTGAKAFGTGFGAGLRLALIRIVVACLALATIVGALFVVAGIGIFVLFVVCALAIIVAVALVIAVFSPKAKKP